MSQKRGERYCDVVEVVRRRIHYNLKRTCVIAVRGYKKSTAPAEKIQDLEFNLRPVAYSNNRQLGLANSN